jgi:protein phosphatase 1 regulatory subunit 7
VSHLTPNGDLTTVYLERNPIQKSADYRRKLKLMLPNLTQIDAAMCR